MPGSAHRTLCGTTEPAIAGRTQPARAFPVTDYRLIQISDIHLSSDDLEFAGARPRDNLVAGLELLGEVDLAPDMLVLTGDLANTGDPLCYQDLAEIMHRAAESLGAVVVYVPGNHDDRPEFRRHLLGQPPDPAPINQVHWIDGLRVVLLDSVVIGQEFGELGEETLAFLRDAVAEPAADGTVLAFHHPPIPSPVEPMAEIMLHHGDRLAEVLVGTDVRLIISGHNHHEELGALGPVPVWVSPATAYRMDILSREAVHALPGCALSQIDLTPRGVTVNVIHVPVGTP